MVQEVMLDHLYFHPINLCWKRAKRWWERDDTRVKGLHSIYITVF